ncbi:hypothetical protein PR003_g10569 [Phytophthora rubi]|uniref:Uncharacterized protein n=1 Tax=Phytophthora rubi TaxID=129364 RepID=A0A6A3M8F8_9STRA|nr:hypothetical protein PR002_g10432 [Phytophthora rubi]KAE9033207.1 hypothetical protein PR001_g10269 [Phytophthora rubi]KAE9340284.1 hypothetical protein PR003_g10569 [Phytophthora rubi]
MSAAPTPKPRKNMTDGERAQVVAAVLALLSNGASPRREPSSKSPPSSASR